MPSIPASASSTRRLMPSSTSTGVAPGYGTVTETVCGSISGKISTLIEPARLAPPTRNISMSRLAATWFEANHASRPRPFSPA